MKSKNFQETELDIMQSGMGGNSYFPNASVKGNQNLIYAIDCGMENFGKALRNGRLVCRMEWMDYEGLCGDLAVAEGKEGVLAGFGSFGASAEKSGACSRKQA